MTQIKIKRNKITDLDKDSLNIAMVEFMKTLPKLNKVDFLKIHHIDTWALRDENVIGDIVGVDDRYVTVNITNEQWSPRIIELNDNDAIRIGVVNIGHTMDNGDWFIEEILKLFITIPN